MRKAMREPLFIEFVDECLKIIEPTSQQLSDKQVGQWTEQQLTFCQSFEPNNQHFLTSR